MYQSQIAGLKEDIIKNGGFEGCQESGSFSGIQILGVRKLPNNINQGRHHLFVDLQDYRGSDFYCVLNSTLHYSFTKPVNEVGCHIDIYGEENSLRLFGSDSLSYSQTLSRLSFAHTSYGHSSYYVYAIKTNNQVVTPTVISEALKTIEQIEELLKHLKGLV